MTQFTLEAAQMGKPLITRDQRPARYVAILMKSNPQFPLVVEVFQYTYEDAKEKFAVDAPAKELFEKFIEKLLLDNSNWNMENYSETGEYLPPFEDDMDLFINSL